MIDDESLLSALAETLQQNQLLLWWDQCYGSPANPHPDWQRRFYDAGAFAVHRMLLAANGVGKSQTVCAELAAHLIGQYPDWWAGKRFTRGGWEAWVGSIDNALQKVGPQRALMGRNIDDLLGTGLIPKHAIVDLKLRQAGVKDVVDTVTVKHVSGENVVLKFMTYEQGWRKWQSGDPRIVLWDEEPDENVVDQKPILNETLTRLVRNQGIWLVGYTPLLGATKLTEHFTEAEDPAIWYTGATWDDAPHMSAEDRERYAKLYDTDAEKEARTKGVPMLGEGRVFRTTESSFVVEPIQIPDHWARIIGIDFGGTDNHPHAIACLAWDRDADIIYLYDVWRENGTTREHANAINSKGTWIPVAWPHDGMIHDKGSGKRFHKTYRAAVDQGGYGVNMLSKSARYKSTKDNDGGAQPVWPVIEEVRNRLDDGQFKVFRTCQKWLQEYRSYHMKEGKIVDRRDDALKASFYGVMMKRYAVSRLQGFSPRRQKTPQAFTTRV